MTSAAQGTAALTAAIAMAVVVSVFAQDRSRGDYKDTFKRGVQAYNLKKWAEAARLFREAIAQQGTETGDRVNISGSDFTPYLPHYFLGVALQNQNNCPEALNEWQQSERQNTIQKFNNEYRNLQRLRPQCDQVVAKANSAELEPLRAPAQAGVAAARKAERDVADIEADIKKMDPRAWQTSGFEAAQAAAKRDLDAAQARLAEGLTATQPSAVREATGLAGRAATAFEALVKPAMDRRDSLQKAAAAAPTRLNPSPTPVIEAPPPPALPATTVNSRTEAPPTTATAAPGPDIPKAEPSKGVTPSRELMAAAQEFFSGKYEQVIAGAKTVNRGDGKTTAHLYLFRAASAYALYLLGDAKDSAQLRAAERDIRSCHELDRTLVPDKRAFSPVFIELFRKTAGS